MISNSSDPPLNLHYIIEKRLNTLNFSNNDIEKIIQNLDPNKAHGHDKVSVRIMKICGKSICKFLQLIFSQCIDTGSFPLEWRKVNIVSVHKKGDKVQSTSPIASNFRKIFQRLILMKRSGFIFETI